MRLSSLTFAGAAVMVFWAAAYPDAASDVRLVEAVKSGDRQVVRSLLREHVDVNAPEVDGTTPLHWAARADDIETVRLLLKAGADAKVGNRYGVTALSLAATNGHAGIIQALLDAGADANGALPEGETVLMTAARTGRVDAVRVVLDRGADVNVKERAFGESALMWAAALNHSQVTRLLLERGAAINARSNALEFAKFVYNGSTMVSTPMARGSLTPLMFAARQGALDAVRVLAVAGADLNLTDPDLNSALVMSIINLHYEVAALLLEKGADPNVADSSGMNAVYGVVEMRTAARLINRPSRRPTGSVDSLDLLKAVLKRGGNPNARLRTPVLQRYHNGGDPLLTGGATSLMRAAKYLDLPAMRLLLDHGADPNLMTKNYTTALMFALGAPGGGNPAADAQAIEAATLCLKRGADVNAFGSDGQTSLHLAAGRGADGIVNFLAEQGAELDLKDRDGRTPLDVAMGVASSAFRGPAFQGRSAAGRAQGRESTAALLRRLMGGRSAKDTSPSK